MANVSELAEWVAGIFRWELDTDAEGGETGAAVLPIKQLANRTGYLKSHVDALESGATVPGALTAHLAASDPHSQYATDSDLSAHVSASDPHPVYATDADLASHVSASNPHPVYATDADLAAHVSASDPHPQYTTAAELSAAISAIAPPAYGAIGCNVFAARANITIGSLISLSPGDSVAGSLLIPSSIIANGSINIPGTGSTLYGTWRCHGYISALSFGDIGATNFTRIA